MTPALTPAQDKHMKKLAHTRATIGPLQYDGYTIGYRDAHAEAHKILVKSMLRQLERIKCLENTFLSDALAEELNKALKKWMRI